MDYSDFVRKTIIFCAFFLAACGCSKARRKSPRLRRSTYKTSAAVLSRRLRLVCRRSELSGTLELQSMLQTMLLLQQTLQLMALRHKVPLCQPRRQQATFAAGSWVLTVCSTPGEAVRCYGPVALRRLVPR